MCALETSPQSDTTKLYFHACDPGTCRVTNTVAALRLKVMVSAAERVGKAGVCEVRYKTLFYGEKAKGWVNEASPLLMVAIMRRDGT